MPPRRVNKSAPAAAERLDTEAPTISSIQSPAPSPPARQPSPAASYPPSARSSPSLPSPSAIRNELPDVPDNETTKPSSETQVRPTTADKRVSVPRPAPPPWKSPSIASTHRDSSTPSETPASVPSVDASAPCDPSPPGGSGDNPPAKAAPPSPVPPTSTGNPTVDNAVHDLQNSPFWIGNPGRILQNCDWSISGASGSSILKWKPDAPDRPEDVDDDALIGWIGQVSIDGSVLRADGGWKTYFQANGAPKHKRNVCVARPPVSRQAIAPAWEAQLRGARALVDQGRRSQTGNLTNYKFCFYENELGTLRSRSQMFRKDDGCIDTDVPLSYQYPTWEFASPQVREVFDNTLSQGYAPQVLEAYDEHDQLIHPNDVESRLRGALVCVFATLEKMLFSGKSQPGGRAWQFYANLVKVQVLEPAPPDPEPTTRKRKFVPSYGSDPKGKRRAVGSMN